MCPGYQTKGPSGAALIVWQFAAACIRGDRTGQHVANQHSALTAVFVCDVMKVNSNHEMVCQLPL
jgi:hypothetical protein